MQTLQELIRCLAVTDEQIEKVLAVRKNFNSSLNFIYDYSFIVDKNLKCLYIPLRGAEIFGLKPADLIGKSWRQCNNHLPEKISERMDEAIKEVLITGNAIHFDESVGPDSQGKYFYSENTLIPVYTSNGAIEAVMINVKDITERKISELKRLKLLNLYLSVNRKLYQLMELCPFGVVLYDEKGKITEINKAYQKRILNFRKENFIGRSGKYLLDAVGLDWEKSASYQALKGIETLNYYQKTSGGNCCLIDAVPLQDCENKNIGAMAVINDITEYEKLKEEMFKLDRLNLIGQMAAGVAHEIRNPMTVIKGYLQFL
jgi:two-component system, sporulation sensor kinase E